MRPMFGLLIAVGIISLAGCKAASELIVDTFCNSLGHSIYSELDKYDSSEPASEHYGASGTER
jgi:hypothetical protein